MDDAREEVKSFLAYHLGYLTEINWPCGYVLSLAVVGDHALPMSVLWLGLGIVGHLRIKLDSQPLVGKQARVPPFSVKRPNSGERRNSSLTASLLTLKPRSHARFLLYATSTSLIMHLICPPPQILHNLCFSFLLGITAVLREIEKQCLCKISGGNKVHYGKCGSGVYRTRAFTGHISISIPISFLKWPIMVWGPTA